MRECSHKHLSDLGDEKPAGPQKENTEEEISQRKPPWIIDVIFPSLEFLQLFQNKRKVL